MNIFKKDSSIIAGFFNYLQRNEESKERFRRFITCYNWTNNKCTKCLHYNECFKYKTQDELDKIHNKQ